ncbi:MAG: hypothetical protein WBG18_04840, partial [Xanthobacteraceae bacterium]
MAALTRSGARNASEIVILTLRTLQHGFNVAADDGIGVYEALHEAGIEPDWVIGTSIGAHGPCAGPGLAMHFPNRTVFNNLT